MADAAATPELAAALKTGDEANERLKKELIRKARLQKEVEAEKARKSAAEAKSAADAEKIKKDRLQMALNRNRLVLQRVDATKEDADRMQQILDDAARDRHGAGNRQADADDADLVHSVILQADDQDGTETFVPVQKRKFRTSSCQ